MISWALLSSFSWSQWHSYREVPISWIASASLIDKIILIFLCGHRHFTWWVPLPSGSIWMKVPCSNSHLPAPSKMGIQTSFYQSVNDSWYINYRAMPCNAPKIIKQAWHWSIKMLHILHMSLVAFQLYVHEAQPSGREWLWWSSLVSIHTSVSIGTNAGHKKRWQAFD